MSRPHSHLRLLLVGFLAWTGVSVAGEFQAIIKDQNGQPIEDAVVLVKPTDDNVDWLLKQVRRVEQVDQIDKEFVPRVKVILVGTTVNFPNKDNIRHQVYSFSPAKIFELPLYSGNSAAPVLFDKPGPVTLGCNIHDWMLGQVYVADTPYYGKSAKEGKVDITDIPAGQYTVRVWHPDMKGSEETTQRKITLDASQAASVEWQLTLRPVFHIPRSVGGAGASYR